MGQGASAGQSHSLLDEIGRNYQEVRREGRGTVLVERDTQNSFLLKEYTFANQPSFQNKLKALQEEAKQGPREYIVGPVRVEAATFKNLCSTNYKVYALFEYPQVTLKDEILARRQESKSFDEGELWSILQSCANALGELKPVASLNPCDIFISAEGQLKSIHDDLLDENFRAIFTHYVLYAPQKLQNFNRVDKELGLRKEGIFSMGMTLLEAAVLEDASVCYDSQQQSFNELVLADLLQRVTDNYSVEFSEVLSNILEVNPNRRASLMEVQKVLDEYWAVDEGDMTQKMDTDEHGIGETLEASPEESQKQPLQPQKSNRLNELECSKVSQRGEHKKELGLPGEVSDYKLRQPQGLNDIITPKNPPTSKENIYTDPRLLEMIRKDLEDINKLKQSGFYETARYSYMYPKTEHILNSIKNLDKAAETERHESSARQIQPTIVESVTPTTAHFDTAVTQSTYAEPVAPVAPVPMRKKAQNLVFSIETYEDGRRYEGMTLNGQKHGQGKLVFEDGAFYEGEFKDDKMHGRGVLYYGTDHPAYEGDWSHDQFHGRGILYNEHPQPLEEPYNYEDFNEVEDYWVKYEGDFVYDNKSGSGKLLLTNKQWLEGEFEDDYVNGEACFYARDNSVVRGVWKMNLLTDLIQ